MSRTRSGPVAVCGHCRTRRAGPHVVLGERACGVCQLRVRRAPGQCPGCGQVKVLAFYDPQRQPSCATCTGNRPVYGCAQCGREDEPFGAKCGPCTLRERLTELLTDPTGQIHPRLRPVLDALMAIPRTQSTLYWLTRTSSRPDLLRAMARGELPISHASFDLLPPDRAVTYLRDLLAANGVIQPYQPSVERITPFLGEVLAGLAKTDADLLERFARWQLLRRLRLLEGRGQVTRSAVQNTRAAILSTSRFLAWLQARGTPITAATQADLERYLARHPGRASTLAPFCEWACRTGIAPPLQVPTAPKSLPDVTLADHERWAQVERLLHQDTVPDYARIAGLFILLFAQPLSRIVRMRTGQIACRGEGIVAVTFDTVAIELPDPLDRLVAGQHAHATGDRYPGHEDRWLFPGRHPGRHLATENFRRHLVAAGIHPGEARKAAMFQLAAEVPTPVLAELLGLAPGTASRWAALAARDWSQYTAMRADPTAPAG